MVRRVLERTTSIASVAAAAAVLTALAVGGAAGQAAVDQDGGAVAGDASQADAGAAATLVPLVAADEEMAGYLRRARKMIAKKDFPGAVEILQSLLNGQQQCFIPTEDRRLYVSLSVAASRAIGELPAEGLKLYRRLYDAEADEILRRATVDLDEAGLREVVRRYFHTSAGDQALNLLGSITFDRGRFSQAARCWHDIVFRYRDSDLDAAALLVKIAVARHFAGQQRQAAEALAKLRAEHADARCRLGGKTQAAVAYTEKVLSAPPPGPVAAAAGSGWPSLAGSPDGVAAMAPCPNPTLQPRWTRPGYSIESNPNLIELEAWLRPQRKPGTPPPDVPAKLQGGHVVWPIRVGSQGGQYTLPAVVHPVVVDNAVIVRDAAAMAAYDLATGDKLWDTFGEFPLYRAPGDKTRRFGGLGSIPVSYFAEDQGRHTLTAGSGNVFGLGGFRIFTLQMYHAGRKQPPQEPDSSALAAFSLGGEGRLMWRSDEPGRPESLRETRFLSAPTHSAGRLYVLGVHMQICYLFCLDAETGRMLWPQPAFVSQVPIVMDVTNKFTPVGLFDRGSAPAVSDGRVFVCTNSGLAAAFDADTGRGLWAYQYDSSLTPPARPNTAGRVAAIRLLQVPYPPNPVIVTRGRVIFLPADGEEAFALRADTGEPAWKQAVGRDKQRHLTAVVPDRILLSGTGMKILDVSDGEQLWSSVGSARKLSEIHGRPAATPGAILASGQGELVIISLSDYSVTALPLAEGQQSLLGNLICVDGKLLAASAAGVTAYFK